MQEVHYSSFISMKSKHLIKVFRNCGHENSFFFNFLIKSTLGEIRISSRKNRTEKKFLLEVYTDVNFFSKGIFGY